MNSFNVLFLVDLTDSLPNISGLVYLDQSLLLLAVIMLSGSLGKQSPVVHPHMEKGETDLTGSGFEVERKKNFVRNEYEGQK